LAIVLSVFLRVADFDNPFGNIIFLIEVLVHVSQIVIHCCVTSNGKQICYSYSEREQVQQYQKVYRKDGEMGQPEKRLSFVVTNI